MMKLGYIKVAKGVRRQFGTNKNKTFGCGYGMNGPRSSTFGAQLCEELGIPCIDLNPAIQTAEGQIIGQVASSPQAQAAAKKTWIDQAGTWIASNPGTFVLGTLGVGVLAFVLARGLAPKA